jgi:hypothetical protein
VMTAVRVVTLTAHHETGKPNYLVYIFSVFNKHPCAASK